MKYIYPKNLDVDSINIIEIKDKYLIKNSSLLNIYGIILKINNFILKKEYNNKYKLILTEINEKLNIYDNFLSSKIENYKNIIIDNEINLTTNHRIEKYSEGKNKEIYLNIHYVKKSGFLNVPKISIL